MRDNPWPSIPRGLQHARRSLRSLVAQAKRSSSGSTPSPSPAPSPSVPSSRPRSLSLAPQQPPRASPSPRTPSTPSPAARLPPTATGYARSPSTTPTRAGGMTLPPQRPARRLPVVHSVRDYPEHLNPFRDDVDEDGSAVPPPLPGMEDDEPTLRPTQDKFGTWTVPRRRSHLNFEQTWSSREYPSTAATPPSPASRGHNGTAAPPRPPVGPRLAAGPSTSGAPTPAPRPPVKPRKKRKAPPPPPPPKAQQRLSSAVSLPQLSQSEGETLANAQPAVTQSQSQVSLACHQDDALSRSASPEDRVGSNPTGPSEPREAPSVEEPDEPPPASGSPVPIHEAGPTSTESLPETEAPEQDAANEERRQSTPPCEDERSGNDSPPAPPRQQDPLSGSPISQRSFRSSTPEAVIMAVEQAPREGGHEEHSPTPSPRSSTSRASSSPEPPLPPPPALSTSPGSSPQGSSPQGSSPHSSPSPLRAASPERLEPQSATSEECPSPPTPASPCSPTRSNEASPTAPTPSPPPPPASPESTARPHCPLAKPEEDADEEDGDAVCREDLSKVIAPAASLITSPRPHLQV